MNFDMCHMLFVIEELCETRNITVAELLRDCGLSRALVANMKKGSIPSIDKILPIADYFNVSLDYLVKGERKEDDITMQTNSTMLSEEEAELLKQFRSLSFMGKFEVLNFATEKAKLSQESTENVG